MARPNEDVVGTASDQLRVPQSERPTISAESHTARIVEPLGDGYPCALSGRELEAGAILDIITFIAESGWRGELAIVSAGDAELTARSLFFDEGQLVGAESNAPDDRLSEVLRRHGLLASEQLSACVAVTSSGRLRFGEAAVELGFATREVVFGWLALQIEEVVRAAMHVENASFAFFRGYEETRLSFRKQHEVGALLERVMGTTTRPKARSCASAATARPLDVIAVYNRAILVLLRELDAMDEGDDVRVELAKFDGPGQKRPSFVDVPAEDGTLDAEAIASRLREVTDQEAAAERLTRWLYDYASYALFLARPHLHRRDDGDGKRPRVSQRVVELLGPISPTSDPVVPSAPTPTRFTIPAPSTPSGFVRRTTEGGPPRSSSTMRMRRAIVNDMLPGLDPSRTMRIAPFSGLAVEAPSTAPTPSDTARRRLATTAFTRHKASRWPKGMEPLLVPFALVAGVVIGWLLHP